MMVLAEPGLPAENKHPKIHTIFGSNCLCLNNSRGAGLRAREQLF